MEAHPFRLNIAIVALVFLEYLCTQKYFFNPNNHASNSYPFFISPTKVGGFSFLSSLVRKHWYFFLFFFLGMLDYVSLLGCPDKSIFKLEDSMEIPPLDSHFVASWCFLLEELILTSLWVNPYFWASEGVFTLSDYYSSTLLGPCCKCFWISDRLYSRITFSSTWSTWALISLSLSAFKIITVAIKHGGVSLSLRPSDYSSLRCKRSSILCCTIHLCEIFQFFLCVETTIISSISCHHSHSCIPDNINPSL